MLKKYYSLLLLTQIIPSTSYAEIKYYNTHIELDNEDNFALGAQGFTLNDKDIAIIDSSAKLRSYDGYAAGVYYFTKNQATLAEKLHIENSTFDVTTHGQDDYGGAVGVYLHNVDNLIVNATLSNVKITSTTDNGGVTLHFSSGIYSQGQTHITADKLTIDAINGYGIYSYQENPYLSTPNSIHLVDSKITSSLHGVFLDKFRQFSTNNVAITTLLENNHGINAEQSIIDLDTTEIKTSAKGSHGIKLASSNFIAKNLNITTKGEDADAINITVQTLANKKAITPSFVLKASQLFSKNGSAIRYINKMKNNPKVMSPSFEIYNSSLGSEKDSSLYIDASNKQNIVIHDSRFVITDDDPTSYAIKLFGLTADIELNGNEISTNKKSNGILIDTSTPSKTVITDGISIDAGNKIAINTNSQVIGSGKMNIQGDLVTQANTEAEIHLTMDKSSFFMGNTIGNNISLTMNDSFWRVPKTNQIEYVELKDNATIEFSSPQFITFSANTLLGQGAFLFKTDIVKQQSDKLIVTQKSEGAHQITIQNQGSQATRGDETLTLVETADGIANFSLSQPVELGGYLYDLRKIDNHWELYAYDEQDETDGNDLGGLQPPFPDSDKAPLTSTADSAASFLISGYLMNQIQMQTLSQRMGQLHGATKGDVWGRVFSGKINAFAHSKLSGLNMKYTGYQLGIDNAYTYATGQRFTGIFAGLTHSNQTQHYQGNGTLKDYSLGFYTSYFTQKGTYLDAVAKYQHHRQKLATTDTQGANVHGRANSNGVQFSVEIGQQITVNEGTLQGWFIQPQLQAAYAWQSGATFNNSNGLQVKLNDSHSLQGRAGLLVGYQANQPNHTTPLTFYFKNSWLQEFAGNTDYRLNGTKEKLTLRNGAWNSGIGVNLNLANRHHLYADLEKSMGNKYDMQQWNLGYRLLF